MKIKTRDIFYTLPEVWDFCLKKIYNRQEYVRSFVELLKKLGVKKESLILDAGCGSGFLTLDLSKKGYRVVATDKSDEMVRQIKINAKNMGVSVEAYNSMWSDLSNKFEPIFDMVYCRGNSLVYAASWERNWIAPSRSYEEIERALKNFYAVLKEGGLFYVDITSKREKPHEESLGTVETRYGSVEVFWKVAHNSLNKIRAWTITVKFLKTGKTAVYPSYSYLLPHKELLRLLKKVGFNKIKKYIKINGEKNYDVFIAQKQV